jgi:hypothetical protein
MSAGGAGPDEDTIIGAARPSGADTAGLESADADTIIVSRAKAPRRRSIAPEPAATMPSAPVEPAASAGMFAIRIGTHEPIPLDVPAYVGRRPSIPRITGTRLPRLVMVPSPNREVSSTHVELHQEGSTVVVTDLDSTNGTTVTNPGLPPVGLRQGESVVLGAGSLVDIGDGIRIIVVTGREDQGEGPS